MSNQSTGAGVQDAIRSIDQGESLKELREALTRAQKHLKSMPDDSNPVDRALLDVAEPLLGQGISLAVTYPVKAQSTVTLLNNVIDETPDDSDGAVVAAMVAHYIAGLRTEGEEKESLTFLTTQMIARVSKRHRGIEDQQTLDTWIEMYELNDVPGLLKRLAGALPAS